MNKQDNEMFKLFWTKLHWCCGDPHQVLGSIYETLKNMQNNSYEQCYESGYKQFMWHALNDAGFADHGSGVGGSWLEWEGRRTVELIEAQGVEWFQDQLNNIDWD